MDKNVPAPAARLLDFIGNIEAPEGYDTLFGNNHRKAHKPHKPITQMTIQEVLERGPSWHKTYGSSAAGRYQFMAGRDHTLQGLYNELNLRPTQTFDPDLQDRLAYHLLLRRGYAGYMKGTISLTDFGRRLAQEWASLPVLADTQGAHGWVTRGQSYYEGDKLNKSLIKPERVEAVLRALKVMSPTKPAESEPVTPVVTKPPPVQPTPYPKEEKTSNAAALWLIGALSALAAGGIAVQKFFPNLFD